jgi:hypothetical protein
MVLKPDGNSQKSFKIDKAMEGKEGAGPQRVDSVIHSDT